MLWTPAPQSQYEASFKGEERNAGFRPSSLAEALGIKGGELPKGCEYAGSREATKVPKSQMLGAECERLKRTTSAVPQSSRTLEAAAGRLP